MDLLKADIERSSAAENRQTAGRGTKNTWLLSSPDSQLSVDGADIFDMDA